jgi:dTDP-4-dehydrorhamnose reductase
LLKTVILGARGQLGAALQSTLADFDPICLDHAALDICDAKAVDLRIRELRPDVVLNAAAYNQVDAAEDEAERAFRVNALAPRDLARACSAAGALIVHFSTDYVFGGDSDIPYREEDLALPRSAYGASKLAGEQFVRSEAALHVVIRTSGLYGLHGQGGKGGNFVETMLGLGARKTKIRVVNDQVLTPTSAADLAAKVVEILERWEQSRSQDLLGLYHVTNAGSCSWYQFASEIFRRSHVEVDLEPISTAEYGARAERPRYSVLAHGHLKRLGLDDMRDWRAALADYLAQRSPSTLP